MEIVYSLKKHNWSIGATEKFTQIEIGPCWSGATGTNQIIVGVHKCSNARGEQPTTLAITGALRLGLFHSQ